MWLLEWGGFSVNRKKNPEILDVTFGEKPKKRWETKKNRYFTKIEPYLYEPANKSSFGIYTQKTKEILFEIW